MLEMLENPAAQMAQEAERLRIARDLHDGVVQSLSALVADLDYFQARSRSSHGEADPTVIEKVQEWQSLARESLISIRQTLGAMRVPPDLDAGLPHAIGLLLEKMKDDGYRIEFECEDWPIWLPSHYATQSYAIVREALTNISKHAHASRVQLNMFTFEERLYISIADDGVGIKQRASTVREGYAQGVIGMRERAALLGGCVTLESVEGKGTRVDVELPLPGNTNLATLAS